MNSSPMEGAVCRPMKVGKEEIIGCLAALEKWLTIDLDDLYQKQTKKLERIAAMAETVPGVATEINTRTGSNHFRQLEVRWDEERSGLSVSACGQQLREGDPSIEVLSNYNPYFIRIAELEKRSPKKTKSKGGPLTVFALGLQDGQELIVGRRLREVLTKGAQAQ